MGEKPQRVKTHTFSGRRYAVEVERRLGDTTVAFDQGGEHERAEDAGGGAGQ